MLSLVALTAAYQAPVVSHLASSRSAFVGVTATPRSTVGALAALRHASSKSAVALSAKSAKTDDGSVLLAGNGAPLPRSREGSLLERLGAGLGLSAKEPP